MENYPVSCRDYALFHFEEPFEQTEYCKQLDKPLNPKALLILTRSADSLPRVKKLVKAARIAGLDVFVREYFGTPFQDNAHVHPVDKNSSAYYEAMATAKYVYTDTPLYADFSKRPEQILIEQAEIESKGYKKRVQLTTLENKADYHIQTDTREGNITEQAFLTRLALRCLRPQTNKTEKKQLLFVINVKYGDKFYPFFQRLSQRVDYSKYDITLLIDGRYADQYAAKLNALDARIHLVLKRGKPLCDAETNRRLAYLKSEHHFIDNPEDVDAFLPNGFFIRERKRLFGDKDFNCIFNLKYDVFYWRWLLRSFSCKKVIANLNNYNSANNANTLSNKTRHIQEHDYSLFLNQDAADAANAFDREGLCSAYDLLPYIPAKRNKKQPVATTLEMPDGQLVLVVNQKRENSLDTINITTIPVFDAPPDYLVLDNHITATAALQQVEALSKQVKQLVVFDFFSVFTSVERSAIRHADNICFINSADAYIALQKELGDCRLPAKQYLAGVQTEAKEFGHTVHYFDENGKETDKAAGQAFDLNTWLANILHA